jgi:hypothetical protein
VVAVCPQAVANDTGHTSTAGAQLLQALNVLHATKVVLEGADHDYGGHRAAA